MGISIYAENAKYRFEMEQEGFWSLRIYLAQVLDDNIGFAYRDWHFAEPSMKEKQMKKLQKNIDWLHKCFKGMPSFRIRDERVLEFLMKPEQNGEVSYLVCGAIYDMIKNVNFEDRYFRRIDLIGDDYEEFKEFLLDCYLNQKSMSWSTT